MSTTPTGASGDTVETTANSTLGQRPSSPPRRAKDIFGDCALVEIIHLHDCFRGALKNLEADVTELCSEITAAGEDINKYAGDGRICDLERRVAGRFTVIWSVFRAHSAAEDEFIWPALKAKQVDLPLGVCACECDSDPPIQSFLPQQQQPQWGHLGQAHGGVEAATSASASAIEGNPAVALGHNNNNNNGGEQHQQQPQRERAQSMTVHTVEQEEYEEDHADEERMFTSIDHLLSNLREELSKNRRRSAASPGVAAPLGGVANGMRLRDLAQTLLEGTSNIMRHLMTHLNKEETHCMPLVAQYLTKAEINDLVGKIMGKRSSELMSQILTMAVQNLNEADRDDMVRYMKQAMVGTFFERWLKMEGWISESSLKKSAEPPQGDDTNGGGKQEMKVAASATSTSEMTDEIMNDTEVSASLKYPPRESTIDRLGTSSTKPFAAASGAAATTTSSPAAASATSMAATAGSVEEDATMRDKHTSAAELEKLIRAIGTNPHLDAKQKNLTIQGLRDSVWKSNCRLSKRKREEGTGDATMMPPAQVARVASSTVASAVGSVAAPASVHQAMSGGGHISQAHHMCFSVSSGVATRFKRETPPSAYFKKTEDGEVKLVWSSDPHSAQFYPNDGSVPLFSASELAPTYHDGGINHVLGCPHYARSCKLRHPTSGRLYTCRLCCEQTREMATNDKDDALDRYEVSEVLCMRCNALQPAGKACVNPSCQWVGKPFARYSCNICNFYDDSPNKSIYHCPFCNVCRTGKGLGIDYRHCMRCNACVSIKDEHHCIPQRLQGNCPICHESMFQSTEPLRGLKCGHVMHLSCFSMYMRGHTYTCPLCMKSADDMSEYFALLDSAVRMQPMPPAYAATTSNIYCQDCCKMGNVNYHFVGLKCNHCGSYNTRELQRVDANIMAGMLQGHY